MSTPLTNRSIKWTVNSNSSNSSLQFSMWGYDGKWYHDLGHLMGFSGPITDSSCMDLLLFASPLKQVAPQLSSRALCRDSLYPRNSRLGHIFGDGLSMANLRTVAGISAQGLTAKFHTKHMTEQPWTTFSGLGFIAFHRSTTRNQFRVTPLITETRGPSWQNSVERRATTARGSFKTDEAHVKLCQFIENPETECCCVVLRPHVFDGMIFYIQTKPVRAPKKCPPWSCD